MSRLLFSIVLSMCLVLTGCANSFQTMAQGEVCTPNAAYSERSECLRNHAATLSQNDSIRGFIGNLEKIETNYQQGLLSESEANALLEETLEEMANSERQNNRQAWALAALGVAVVAVAAAAAADDTGGGYYSPYDSYGSYQTPLMCSQAPVNASPRCTTGKACGNTCISASNTCHIGRGSACNVYYRSYP